MLTQDLSTGQPLLKVINFKKKKEHQLSLLFCVHCVAGYYRPRKWMAIFQTIQVHLVISKFEHKFLSHLQHNR